MGWNDVFSDPKVSEPNAAMAGTIIQNWGKKPTSSFAAKGFPVVDSTYTEMYLSNQCCRIAPPTGPYDKFKLCYWRDASEGISTDLRKLVDGGEVAMWSDLYCGSPHCAINGTYGWMCVACI